MMLASSRTDDGSSVQRRMRSSFILLACLSAACLSPAQAFQSSAPVFLVKSRIAEVGALFANEKEDYLPEVSFGAEVVPDGQKPVNEYQDMMNAPLFGWGSNEVGVQGVSWLRPIWADLYHSSQSSQFIASCTSLHPLCHGICSCVSQPFLNC